MKKRPEVTGSKVSVTDLDAYSISQFCQKHGISIATFYKLKDQMPVTFNVGNRVLISRESAAAWRRKREELAAATA